MTEWATFAAFAGVVLALLLLLARASQSLITESDASASVDAPGSVDSPDPHGPPDSSGPPERRDSPGPSGEAEREEEPDGDRGSHERVSARGRVAGVDASEDARRADAPVDGAAPDAHGVAPDARAQVGDGPTVVGGLSTTALLANVAVSQGAFGLLLLAGAWYAAVPASAFGVTPETTDLGAAGVGVALGVALYLANEVGAAAGERFGLGGSEALRAALAPDSALGWAALLLVVLPIIAGFEELLFRGALVGALHAGFGVSPWLLALGSSVAFALGHGAQGPVGIAVTGALGFVLAAAFVLTDSLLVVVVAHYLVNALEFIVHEGFGLDWARDGRRGREAS